MVFDEEEQTGSMRSSLRLEEKPGYETERTSDDNLLYTPLVPILEYQKVRPTTKPTTASSKSTLDPKFNKEKPQSRAGDGKE